MSVIAHWFSFATVNPHKKKVLRIESLVVSDRTYVECKVNFECKGFVPCALRSNNFAHPSIQEDSDRVP